jgi:hypothetical protein
MAEQMLQQQITPKYINPPKENQRSGSVKDESGQYWGCPPNMLHQFQVGAPVTVFYSTRTVNGKTYHNIEAVVGAYNPPPQQQAPLPPRVVPPPAAGHNGGPSFGGEAPEKQENIFICGVVNNAIAHQSYPLEASALTQLIQVARLAWRNAKLPI